MPSAPSNARLAADAVQTALASLDGWQRGDGESIVRAFKFRNFSEAFGFMTRIALLTEKAGHHPDWSNSYNRVEISLSTHDAGGITQKDIDLARAINALA